MRDIYHIYHIIHISYIWDNYSSFNVLIYIFTSNVFSVPQLQFNLKSSKVS